MSSKPYTEEKTDTARGKTGANCSEFC